MTSEYFDEMAGKAEYLNGMDRKAAEEWAKAEEEQSIAQCVRDRWAADGEAPERIKAWAEMYQGDHREKLDEILSRLREMWRESR